MHAAILVSSLLTAAAWARDTGPTLLPAIMTEEPAAPADDASSPEPDRCRWLRESGAMLYDGRCEEYWGKEAARRERKIGRLVGPAPEPEPDKCRWLRESGAMLYD